MNEDLEPIYRFMLESLNISPDAKMEWAYPVCVGEREMLIDLAIESGNTITLVEIKHRIDEDVIYRIYALSHLISKQFVDKKELRLVCAGKSLKYSTRELAAILGVETLLIPPKLYQYLLPRVNVSRTQAPFEHLKASPSKLTGEKAWKIICYLLTKKPPNILAVSRDSGVSYGWTNSIIHKLEDYGIITVDYDIRIKEIDKLFNIVSWERPLDSLFVKTVDTNFINSSQCINEVALNFNKLGIDYAFTAHSSAVSYGSTIMREDTAYIYLSKSSYKDAIRFFSESGTGGCRLKVYTPDRDLIKSSTVLNGVRVVDVCQNILDLAGLGMDGRNAAKDLVNKSGK